MSNYTPSVDFAAKDDLTTGDPNKVVKGSEISSEFSAVQTAVNSKADSASPTLTGTGTAVNLTVSGTLNASGTFQVGGVAVTATATELNLLDGVTATTTEINLLDGVTATTAEINKVDGFTGTVDDLNYAKDLRATGVTATEFDYLDGVTGPIQTQLNEKEDSANLGTAASKDVTTSTTDTTAGRLLKVGDFGWGAANTSVNVPDGDADALRANGVYRITSLVTGTPLQDRIGQLLHAGQITDFAAQLVMGAQETEAYLRNIDGGVPGPWFEVFHQGSILGTVSQSAGVPTGAVIERGSNANGEFVKLADGTMICSFIKTTADTANTAIGSIFTTSGVTFSFPATFAAAPIVSPVFERVAGSIAHWAMVRDQPTTTQCSLGGITATNGASGYLGYTAVGRWF